MMASKHEKELEQATQDRNELAALLLAVVVKAGGEIVIGRGLMVGAAEQLVAGTMYVNMETVDGDVHIRAFRAHSGETH